MFLSKLYSYDNVLWKGSYFGCIIENNNEMAGSGLGITKVLPFLSKNFIFKNNNHNSS